LAAVAWLAVVSKAPLEFTTAMLAQEFEAALVVGKVAVVVPQSAISVMTWPEPSSVRRKVAPAPGV
jgi:hypothetical protein